MRRRYLPLSFERVEERLTLSAAPSEPPETGALLIASEWGDAGFGIIGPPALVGGDGLVVMPPALVAESPAGPEFQPPGASVTGSGPTVPTGVLSSGDRLSGVFSRVVRFEFERPPVEPGRVPTAAEGGLSAPPPDAPVPAVTPPAPVAPAYAAPPTAPSLPVTMPVSVSAAGWVARVAEPVRAESPAVAPESEAPPLGEVSLTPVPESAAPPEAAPDSVVQAVVRALLPPGGPLSGVLPVGDAVAAAERFLDQVAELAGLPAEWDRAEVWGWVAAAALGTGGLSAALRAPERRAAAERILLGLAAALKPRGAGRGR